MLCTCTSTTFHHQNTQISILEAQVSSLQEPLFVEKGKRVRGKPLMNEYDFGGEAKAMFFSPSKIQGARQRREQLRQERTEAELRKEAEKLRKQQEKEAKQLLVVQRKAAREEVRLQRKEEQLKKQQQQAEQAEQRNVDKQLNKDVKQAKQCLKTRRARSKSQQQEKNAIKEVLEEEGGQSRSSRYGRQLKPHKHFGN